MCLLWFLSMKCEQSNFSCIVMASESCSVNTFTLRNLMTEVIDQLCVVTMMVMKQVR